MMDGGLSAPALAAAQAHVADCARCQNLLGAMARIESSAPAETNHRAFGWLTWAVPLTAAAAVVAVWIAVPHQNETAQSVPVPPAASVERRAPEAPVAPDVQEKQENKEKFASKADDVQLQRREAVTTHPAPSAAAAVDALRSSPQRADAVGTEIQSPDPMIRWRVLGSAVERSTDGGTRWAIQPTGIEAELAAGSAASPLVVWVVGRRGAVLVSTDGGGSWRRVQFPEMTDLSAARARDAQSVAVTTSDGRVFSTTDAGLTWVPRPLQGF
jgi:hypothetical protein